MKFLQVTTVHHSTQPIGNWSIGYKLSSDPGSGIRIQDRQESGNPTTQCSMLITIVLYSCMLRESAQLTWCNARAHFRTWLIDHGSVVTHNQAHTYMESCHRPPAPSQVVVRAVSHHRHSSESSTEVRVVGSLTDVSRQFVVGRPSLSSVVTMA